MVSPVPNLLFAVTILCSLPSITASPSAAVGKPINTTSGLIVGHAEPNHPEVGEYLGIPFAKPPVGNLRFAPPQPYAGNKRIIADKQPTSCAQAPTTRNASQPQPEQNIDASKTSFTQNTSEDCLYLNVWTKQSRSCPEKKPVVVWIYGGGFHSGGASDNSEQGGLFVNEQDIVVVSFNYRLGFFGFSGAPDLAQNAALLDQRLALEWVRDNIEAFGGDKTKITIMGHSAGGASVDYYTYAWLDDPIIAGAIPMSGTATSFGHRTLQTGAKAWQATAQLIGCASSNATSEDAILDCMRQKTTKELFEASAKAGVQVAKSLPKEHQLFVGVTGIYSPTVDDKTVFANYSMRAQQGKLAKVPVVTGDNIDEACFFSQNGQFAVTADPDVNEVVFNCPALHAATFRAAAGIPAWKYLWLGGYPNQNFPVCPGKPWHGSEVYVMFGSTKIASGQDATKKEEDNGQYMRKSVATFARNPSTGLLTGMHWPKFDANKDTVVALASNQTDMTVGSSAATDKICKTKLRDDGPNY